MMVMVMIMIMMIMPMTMMAMMMIMMIMKMIKKKMMTVKMVMVMIRLWKTLSYGGLTLTPGLVLVGFWGNPKGWEFDFLDSKQMGNWHLK